jgi:hypothetical protein
MDYKKMIQIVKERTSQFNHTRNSYPVIAVSNKNLFSLDMSETLYATMSVLWLIID